MNMRAAAALRAILVTTIVAVAGFVVLNASGGQAAAADCDSNAVIRCGVSSVSGLVSKYDNDASVRHIYNASPFNISSADIHAMSGDSQMGSVSSNGDVSVNGRVVATGATTAGRESMSNSCGGSTRHTNGGTTFFTRAPCVSFASSPLSAFVVMKNGVFQFAILTSCGNPVVAHPKTPPPAPKPTPKPTPTPKPKVIIKKVQPKQTNKVCSGNTTNVNNGGIASQGGNCSQNTTIVQLPSTPSPSGACTSLGITVSPTDQRTITAMVNFSSVNGAQLQSVTFDFGDGTVTPASTQTTATHTFQQDGNFIIKAMLMFTGGQSSAPATCQAQINVAAAKPTCDVLNVSASDDQTVTITQFQTTDNGATFTGADIDWGDGNTDAGVNPVVGQSHQYTTPGTFTINVVPHFMVNGQDVTASSDACMQQVTVAAPAAPTTPSTPVTTSSAPESTTPTSLVNTGAGSVLAVFGISAAAGTFGYRYFLRRHLSAK
jgi:hypothetical protein